MDTRNSEREEQRGFKTMNITKRKPVSVGEVLTEEFMKPLSITQDSLAKAMGVSRKTVNELCNNRRSVTAATALLLGKVFNNSAEFWLNLQRRTDIWNELHNAKTTAKLKKAKQLTA